MHLSLIHICSPASATAGAAAMEATMVNPARAEIVARPRCVVVFIIVPPTLPLSLIHISSLSACIEKLHKRICGTDLQSQMTGRCSFPHEIGFFLGYPYEDVIGFIDNEGENFLCSGCWKVYAKERDAQTCFCCYKNCTTMYQQLFDEGVSIECLAAVDEDFPAAEAFRAAG